MNRDQKAAVVEEVAAPDPGVGGGLRRRLPRDLRAPGGRAAREAERGRRALPGGQEHADPARRRQGRGRDAQGAARGPDRVHVRDRRGRRRGAGRQGARPVPPRARAARVQGRRDGRRGAHAPSRSTRSSRLPARDVLHGQLVGDDRLADHRPGARAERADRRAWRSSCSRSPSRGWSAAGEAPGRGRPPGAEPEAPADEAPASGGRAAPPRSAAGRRPPPRRPQPSRRDAPLRGRRRRRENKEG